MTTISQKFDSFLASFPVPQFLSMHSAGIDISPKAVRLVQLQHTKHGVIPVAHEELRLKKVCDVLQSDDDVKLCAELKEALITLKQKYDLQFANVSLPELKTYIFKTSIKKNTIADIDAVLAEKIQENVPLEMHNIIYDYSIAEKAVYGSDVEVVVTVFPRNVIAAYTHLFEEVGIVPTAFESESQSIARAVISHEDTTPYLLINLDFARVNLAIVEHALVNYTSSISYDSDALIADEAGDEAQQLKRKINQLLVYWFTNRRHTDADAEKITTAILTGPFADNQKLHHFFETHAHINVTPANIWKNCFDLNDHVPEIGRADSLKYATSVGLALLHQ